MVVVYHNYYIGTDTETEVQLFTFDHSISVYLKNNKSKTEIYTFCSIIPVYLKNT